MVFRTGVLDHPVALTDFNHLSNRRIVVPPRTHVFLFRLDMAILPTRVEISTFSTPR
jgi:hypothetical protein